MCAHEWKGGGQHVHLASTTRRFQDDLPLKAPVHHSMKTPQDIGP